MTSTRKGEVLKFVTCLLILLFLEIDLWSIFADGVSGGQKIGHFLWTP